ncbi:MAG: flavodoxin family protein [Spirochaetales bacterium]|nr:flavodoxin family protein [Spirochaetales bacterium]
MHRILIINGSFRKKNTFSILKKIEDSLSGNEIDFVNIKDFNIKPCTGCETCLKKGFCPINDDCNKVFEKMVKADGIIIGNPVYLRQLSGYLKILFDRACSWYHRTPLYGKPVFLVSTTQASGLNSTDKLLHDITDQWGMIYTGSVLSSVFNRNKILSDESNWLKKFNFYLDSKNKRYYRPSFKMIFEFSTQKMLAKNVLTLDKEYWNEKKWFSMPYYYKCRINPLKKLTSLIFYKIGSHFIGKSMKK